MKNNLFSVCRVIIGVDGYALKALVRAANCDDLRYIRAYIFIGGTA